MQAYLETGRHRGSTVRASTAWSLESVVWEWVQGQASTARESAVWGVAKIEGEARTAVMTDTALVEMLDFWGIA